MWFVYTYGIKAAKKMLGGNLFAYTPTGAAQMGAKKGVTPDRIEEAVYRLTEYQ